VLKRRALASASANTAPAPLACTVRDCGLPLTRRERAYVCRSGHSFDIARSGYVNLLQDRRSLEAGDSKAAVDARAALERTGVGSGVIEAVIDKVLLLDLPLGAVIVDLGSGSGEMLGRLSTRRQVSGIGIDLSSAAAEFSVRRFPALTWVVANADRRLPLRDNSVEVVLSIHGRRNPAECTRVLTPTGRLIVVIPAPDDLIELRAVVQGQVVERDRVEAMLVEHQTFFRLDQRVAVREQLTLEHEALLNVLRGTYRGARFRLSERVGSILRLQVTLSSELCVFQKR
jgi:23S rRNA (guanine745-N1)-methyltransferase